jgi:hypothetical protein
MAKEWVRVFGGQARRGQQFAGGTDSPDVISSHENLHLEVKRVEAGNPYTWIRPCGMPGTKSLLSFTAGTVGTGC